MTLRRVPSSIVKSTRRGRCAKSPKDCPHDEKKEKQINVLSDRNKQTTYFESHKLVIRAWRPGVDLDAVTQGNDEEFDLFIFDNLEVDRALEVADIDPAVALLNVLVANALGAQNLGLEPREVVNADPVLLARHRHQDVLTFEHFHLLEPPTRYQLVDFALAAPVEQHQPVLRSNQQIDSCD